MTLPLRPLVLGFGVLCAPVSAAAQAATPVATPAPSVEHAGIGAVGGFGIPDLMGAVRVSVPAGPRNAFDVDAGGIMSAGTTYGVQIRHLFHPRGASRRSAYVVVGVVHVRSESRTEVRFPNGVTQVSVKAGPPLTPQVGVGTDWLSSHGVRAGFELTTGGTSTGGPVIYAKICVLWGPALR